MKKAILISLAFLGLFFLAVILQFQSPNEPKDIRTLTKALCNSTNYCQDYLIIANNINFRNVFVIC